MFTENIKKLPSIEHLHRIELFNDNNESVATIENKPGQAGSLAVYHYLAQTYGMINAQAAQKGLDLYAEHTEDARQRPGKHPNIDRLFNVIHSSDTFKIQQYTQVS